MYIDSVPNGPSTDAFFTSIFFILEIPRIGYASKTLLLTYVYMPPSPSSLPSSSFVIIALVLNCVIIVVAYFWMFWAMHEFICGKNRKIQRIMELDREFPNFGLHLFCFFLVVFISSLSSSNTYSIFYRWLILFTIFTIISRFAFQIFQILLLILSFSLSISNTSTIFHYRLFILMQFKCECVRGSLYECVCMCVCK